MVRNRILMNSGLFDGKIVYRNPSGLKKSFFVFFGKIGLELLEKFRLGIINFYTNSAACGGVSLGWKNS
jgi:hypothetical protein